MIARRLDGYFLGRRDYRSCLALQEQLHAARVAGSVGRHGAVRRAPSGHHTGARRSRGERAGLLGAPDGARRRGGRHRPRRRRHAARTRTAGLLSDRRPFARSQGRAPLRQGSHGGDAAGGRGYRRRQRSLRRAHRAVGEPRISAELPGPRVRAGSGQAGRHRRAHLALGDHAWLRAQPVARHAAVFVAGALRHSRVRRGLAGGAVGRACAERRAGRPSGLRGADARAGR